MTATFIPLPDASIERETEKALLLAVGYSHACGHAEKKVWFPRSTTRMIDGTVYVAAWMLGKKEKEIRDEYPGFYNFHADGRADALLVA